MAETPETDAVTVEAHRAIITMIVAKLPEGSALMIIGGGLMMESGLPHVLTTRDEDVVLLVVEAAGPKVADATALERLIVSLGAEPVVRPDQTNVSCRLATPKGTFLVEFIRGRRGGHGYFIARAVLEKVAGLSRREGQLLIPPLEALAFLKAWAAVDKAKLVATGRDRHGYHAAREKTFRRDVGLLRENVLAARAPTQTVLKELLAACSQDRERAVRKVLEEAGWKL